MVKNMLTYMNERVDFEKEVLNIIISQIDDFTHEDIYRALRRRSDATVPNEYILDIVCTSLEFCLNENFIEVYDRNSYTINLLNQEEFEGFIDKFSNNCFSI